MGRHSIIDKLCTRTSLPYCRSSSSSAALIMVSSVVSMSSTLVTELVACARSSYRQAGNKGGQSAKAETAWLQMHTQTHEQSDLLSSQAPVHN